MTTRELRIAHSGRAGAPDDVNGRRESLRGAGRWRVGSVLFLLLLAAVVGLGAPRGGAQENAQESPDVAQQLAEKYAPIMMLKTQDGPCDSDGEPYGPTSIDIVLDNPEVVLRQVSPGNPVVMTAPGASDLFRLGQGFYLDFPGDVVAPDCIFETDFRKYSQDLPAVVYAHIVQQDGHPDQLALQYWFYWYYNDWNNKHESDWEGIQLLFDASTVDAALASDPVSVGYAQHEGGERAEWDSSKLEREGARPVVYSSAGSHASYYGSALYLGRSAGEGFGCDNTDGPSDRIDPEVVLLPDTVEDPDSPLAWLAFGGRWGERRNGPFNGPTGPAAKERWLEPIDWHEELRDASVIVPKGDSQATAVISGFCGVIESGSGVLISFTTSPLRLLIGFGLMVLLARWAALRTTWESVDPSPLRRRRRAGQIIRLAPTGYRRAPWTMLTFSLVYLPTAIVVAVLAAFVSILPVLGDIAGVAGRASGTSLVLALLAGGLPHLVALILVTAMTAANLGRRADGRGRPPATDAVKLVWSRRRPLAAALLRASAIVIGLCVTVVGIPWGIRQLVRYQFAPHAVVLEDLDGQSSLARSSELVNGRWWHTAVMVATVNALVVTAAMVVGVILLVVFNQVPLWLFSILITLVSGLVVPVAAVALTMLYGDAVAEKEGSDKALPVLA
jgi:hypothetical protein